MENYRPIANLCSTSKVFEKLILKRIMELQDEKGVDFTGKQQHGFKKNHGTSTLGIQLQSIIARALDDSKYVLMASLDLSAAFDLVNVKLLIKRLYLIGLPKDVIELIKIWLTGRMFYVSIDGKNSIMLELLCGTVQGSILGPILYAIYVSPVFHVADMSNFADDNFIISWSESKVLLVNDMETKLEAITRWLKKSGLIVNETKTELCLFYKKDTHPVEIFLNGTKLHSKKSINALGVLFDSKLQWTDHVALTIKKANGALNAIKLIKRFFTQTELIQLLTSNFYSILYYNSEIWHLNNLNVRLKQLLLSASAKAIKVCLRYPDPLLSYIKLHEIVKRATPSQFLLYKHSILLYKLFNGKQPMNEWCSLNFQQIMTPRQTKFKVAETNLNKIGKNILVNRLSVLNDKIPMEWLNLSLTQYKLKIKSLFLL